MYVVRLGVARDIYLLWRLVEMEDSSNRPTACNITVLVLSFFIIFLRFCLAFFLSFFSSLRSFLRFFLGCFALI